MAPTRTVNGIITRVLHGKDYVEVHERVRILHELRKAGEIKEFEMVESQPHEIANRLIWRCSSRIDGKLYIGNAEVKLDAPKNTPDGTNPFECAETSAFGRMLAFAGLGTVESIASYDEIMRGQPFVAVIEQQKVVESGNAPPPVSQEAGKPSDKAISDLVARAKSRAIQARIVHNLTEWQALLEHLQIKEIKSVADIGKINEYLSNVEQKQANGK